MPYWTWRLPGIHSYSSMLHKLPCTTGKTHSLHCPNIKLVKANATLTCVNALLVSSPDCHLITLLNVACDTCPSPS